MDEKILKMLFQHFGYNPNTSNSDFPFYTANGDGHMQFLLNLKQSDSYEQYSFNGSLFMSIISETSNEFIASFLDLNTQFFIFDKLDQRNAPQLHKHDYIELAYVVSGSLDLEIESTYRRMLPGDAYIINPNVKHVELRNSPHVVIYVGIKTDYFENLTSDFENSQSKKQLDDFIFRNQYHSNQIDYLIFTILESFQGTIIYENLQKSFIFLIDELLTKQSGYQQIASLYINRIFSALQNPAAYICSNTRFQDANSDLLFERTLHFLNDQKRKITRKELAIALRYNGSYISRVFLKHTGQSLADYNRDICLNESARLLLNTKLNISEIILMVGYENKTVFYSHFVEKFAMTPQQYRLVKFQETKSKDDMIKEYYPREKNLNR